MKPPRFGNALNGNTVGSLLFAASSINTSPLIRTQLDTSSASACSRVIVLSVPSISSRPLNATDSKSILCARAAFCASFHSPLLSSALGRSIVDLPHSMIATREMLGNASLRSSSCLPVTQGEMVVKPVTFPPGRARLATNPCATASAELAITMGMVAVASLAASAAVPVVVTMISTLRPSNSTTWARSRSTRFSQKRCSTTMF
jgi:hypothetical protein